MLLKNCRFLVTQGRQRKILENTSVLIEGNRIAKVGKNLKAKTETIDCSKKIVMPGLVNTHTHLGMGSLRGMCDDEELFPWLENTGKLEKKLSEKQVKANTLAGIREAVRLGTTTIYDSYKFPEARVKVFEKTGVRGVVSATVKDAKSLKESVSFLRGMRESNVKGFIAANSINNCGEETLLRIVEFSEKEGVMRRIHVGETRKERFDVLKDRGKLVIDYLDSIGFLGKKSLLVHCIWITKGEIRKIARMKAKVSHNPVSNMKLASGGVMPLTEMLGEKVCVGLGTDSTASNNNLDMFEEMKVCALLHRHHKWNPKAVSAQEILDMATLRGAECLGIEGLGSIEEGKKADIITIDIGETLVPVNDAVSTIVFGASGMHVSDSVVDGKALMREGKLLF